MARRRFFTAVALAALSLFAPVDALALRKIEAPSLATAEDVDKSSPRFLERRNGPLVQGLDGSSPTSSTLDDGLPTSPNAQIGAPSSRVAGGVSVIGAQSQSKDGSEVTFGIGATPFFEGGEGSSSSEEGESSGETTGETSETGQKGSGSQTTQARTQTTQAAQGGSQSSATATDTVQATTSSPAPATAAAATSSAASTSSSPAETPSPSASSETGSSGATALQQSAPASTSPLPDATPSSSPSAAQGSLVPAVGGHVQTAAQAYQLPGRQIQVAPIGLGVFAGVSSIAVGIVGLVTYERKKYRNQYRERKRSEGAEDVSPFPMSEAMMAGRPMREGVV